MQRSISLIAMVTAVAVTSATASRTELASELRIEETRAIIAYGFDQPVIIPAIWHGRGMALCGTVETIANIPGWSIRRDFVRIGMRPPEFSGLSDEFAQLWKRYCR